MSSGTSKPDLARAGTMETTAEVCWILKFDREQGRQSLSLAA